MSCVRRPLTSFVSVTDCYTYITRLLLYYPGYCNRKSVKNFIIIHIFTLIDFSQRSGNSTNKTRYGVSELLFAKSCTKGFFPPSWIALCGKFFFIPDIVVYFLD